jgi:hypothetical protein
MKDLHDSLETFFLSLFNSSVPAYTGDDTPIRQQIRSEMMEKWPGCINPGSGPIIDYRGIGSGLTTVSNEVYANTIREITEYYQQAIESVSPDYYPIVDGGWLATHANLQKTGIPYISSENIFSTASEWLDYTLGKKTLSITRGNRNYWIWSDGNIFLLIAGNTTALIMTRSQMERQVFVKMITPPITTYCYAPPILNWISYPFNYSNIID